MIPFGRGSFRNSGGADDGDTSRPTSSMSRTHVPSLTPGGFFKPMSSQKLQAQRGQRPASSLAQNVIAASDSARDPRRSEESTRTGHRHRYSNASVNTLRDRPPPTRDEDVPPLPVSRGTAFTNDGTSTHPDVPQHGAPSVISNNSVAPLHGRQSPANLKLDSSGLRSSKEALSPASKSPRSLRASLRLSSRRPSQQERRPSPGQHEKLHSDPSSPNDAPEKPPLPLSASMKPRIRSPRSTSQGKGKNYEYFAGNMLFLLSGRLMNSKARPLNVATFVLTVLPAALFFAFSAPWLWRHVSPALPILFAYVFYITISALLHAAFSDPGILPRNLHPHPSNPDEERDPLTVGPPTTEWVMVKTFPSNKASKQQVDNEAQRATTAMEVPTKYCKSCNIWRPPRAHHCRICDACIETQDHHCVWLNNCVGRRNYRFFFAYVGWASVLALMLLSFSLAHIGTYAQQHSISFGRALSGRSQERVAFAMFLISVFALPYPASLFVYHLFLIARGETTREYLNSHKFMPKDRHRPFSQANWWRNWVSVLVRPRTPSYMQFRHAYQDGDVRYGHTKPKWERKAELKGRFSVGGAAAEGEKDKGVEMKQLPPQPRDETANGDGSKKQRRWKMKQLPPLPGPQQLGPNSAAGLSGPVNSTPR